MVSSSIPGGVDAAEVGSRKGPASYKAEFDRPPAGHHQFRMRRGQESLETARIGVQIGAVCMTLFICICIVLAYKNETQPLHVPGMVFEATFGPTDRLWQLEAPFMNRTRYETPGNFWRPVMFPPESNVGWLQDSAYGLWNWGVRNIWFGTPQKKALAILATLMIWLLIGFMALTSLQIVAEFMPFHVKRVYLMFMPEQWLILEQLIVARRLGRRLRTVDQDVGENGAIEP
jgi:hypothetical protein